MAELGGANSETCALEIGPGIGVLTAELAKLSKKVTAVEIDSTLIPILKDTLSDFDNVSVINGDVMKTDVKKIIEEDFSGEETVVCANLPYYITSPIIMYLLESRFPIKSVTVMVQKEAAKRLCAKPGSREAGAVSCAVSYYSSPKILFNVSAGSFLPAPKVDSSVIKLDILKKPPVEVKDEELLFKVIRSSFLLRRKTLANSVSSGLSIEKAKIYEALKSCGISENCRGEKLTLEDFARLTDCFCSMGIFL
jgi:16S rRNA (adenine1518-N6/adenine1519-N6)-dimethyltransferase